MKSYTNFFYSVLFSLSFFLCLLAQEPVGSQVGSLSVALQNDGKAVVGGFATICESDQIMLARYLTNGTLDGTFNGLGYVVTSFGEFANANAITLQSDQKIVVSGVSDDTIALLRYTSSGVLDATFGQGGRVNFNLGTSEAAHAVQMQNSKILVAGSALGQFLLIRFNGDGTLDTNFGTNSGYTTTLIGNAASARAMGQQSNGRIILAGTSIISVPHFSLARYTSNGSLDTSFGTNGIVRTVINSSSIAHALAIDGSNNIIVVGEANLSTTNIAVARYTSSGALDNTFGSGGITTIDLSGAQDFGFAVALQSDGKIVLAGQTDNELFVARLTTAGALDTTFNTTGFFISSFGVSSRAFGIAVQPSDQKIVVVGQTDRSALAMRFNTNGTLDSTYGTGGIVTQPTGSAATACGTGGGLEAYGYLYNNNFNITLSASGATAIPFTNDPVLQNISHDAGINPENIIPLVDGVYLATVMLGLTSTGTGVAFNLELNGGEIAGTSTPAQNPGTTTIQAQFTALANDVINLVETGLVNLTLQGNASITLEKIA